MRKIKNCYNFLKFFRDWESCSEPELSSEPERQGRSGSAVVFVQWIMREMRNNLTGTVCGQVHPLEFLWIIPLNCFYQTCHTSGTSRGHFFSCIHTWAKLRTGIRDGSNPDPAEFHFSYDIHWPEPKSQDIFRSGLALDPDYMYDCCVQYTYTDINT
jgi:hypothetical protein